MCVCMCVSLYMNYYALSLPFFICFLSYSYLFVFVLSYCSLLFFRSLFYKDREKECGTEWEGVRRTGQSRGRRNHNKSILCKNLFSIKRKEILKRATKARQYIAELDTQKESQSFLHEALR